MKIALLTAALLLVAAPAAEARVPLTKREARKEGLRFAAPFVDLLDIDRGVKTKMVPPRKCKRVSPRTVTCGFSARLADGRAPKGTLRIHRQRDGLLGFLFPWDILKMSVGHAP